MTAGRLSNQIKSKQYGEPKRDWCSMPFGVKQTLKLPKTSWASHKRKNINHSAPVSMKIQDGEVIDCALGDSRPLCDSCDTANSMCTQTTQTTTISDRRGRVTTLQTMATIKIATLQLQAVPKRSLTTTHRGSLKSTSVIAWSKCELVSISILGAFAARSWM
jgi:hypothetical protein